MRGEDSISKERQRVDILISGTSTEDLIRAMLMFRGHEIVKLSNHGDLVDREYAVGSACSGRIRTLPTTEDGEDWIRVEEVRQLLKSVPAVIQAERSE